jgi:hypothetical protein
MCGHLLQLLSIDEVLEMLLGTPKVITPPAAQATQNYLHNVMDKTDHQLLNKRAQLIHLTPNS